MHKWEYKSVGVSENQGKNGELIYDEDKEYTNVDELLNELGSQGWELVSEVPIFSQFNGIISTAFISYRFKRPIEAE